MKGEGKEKYIITICAKTRALGCVKPPPAARGRHDSRNLGPALSRIPVHWHRKLFKVARMFTCEMTDFSSERLPRMQSTV